MTVESKEDYRGEYWYNTLKLDTSLYSSSSSSTSTGQIGVAAMVKIFIQEVPVSILRQFIGYTY
jgi:hypothetical protein